MRIYLETLKARKSVRDHLLKAAAVCGFWFAVASSANAAVRTVQFTGLMGADFTVGAVGNEASVAYCSVAIVNTGREDQRIVNIEMLPYFQGNQMTQNFTNSGLILTMRRVGAAPLNTPGNTANNTGSNPPTNACLGQTLEEGSICVARMPSSTILLDGRYLVCAGRISVEDIPGGNPGSVTAAGSITINQEAVLLGGVMSGAYYQSGSHILDRDNLEQMSNPTTHNIFNNSPNPPGATQVMGMNIYCARACRMDSSELSTNQCQEMCGFGHGNGVAQDTSTGALEWSSGGYWNSIGLITEAGSYGGKQWCANGDGGGTDPNGSACNPADPDSPADPSTSWPRSSRKLVMKAANAHFAGGMVYEMLMGPMNVICSANRAYWAAGGNEMLHADGVDDHSITFGADTSYPPERLFCAHRHAEDDLHLRVGSSSSFTVNGGNPF